MDLTMKGVKKANKKFQSQFEAEVERIRHENAGELPKCLTCRQGTLLGPRPCRKCLSYQNPDTSGSHKI